MSECASWAGVTENTYLPRARHVFVNGGGKVAPFDSSVCGLYFLFAWAEYTGKHTIPGK